ncbi:MAG: hypothetical protein A4E19_10505 [Nitrospira sp. SG-bin1]|nr:MAG: hypothetical protein A4E19_10505 [Nitrospira sp. SG-bin1]
MVYLIRSPVHALHRALFSEDTSEVVVSLEAQLSGEVVRGMHKLGVKAGDKLSYSDVIDILLKAEKILTL